MNELHLLPGFLIILLVFISWEVVLLMLNERQRRRGVPVELSGLLAEDSPERYDRYQRAKFRFEFADVVYAGVLTILFIGLKGPGLVASLCNTVTSHPIGSTLLFFAVIWIASEALMLPLEWYETFVLEEKFGFNTTTPATFFTDKAKGGLITLLVGGFLMGVLLWLIVSIGPSFWWYFWIVAIGFMLFMQVYYTSLIVPLFNTLQPLPSGQLRDAIEAYCAQVQFPLSNLYVLDGSKRSTKANAFFSGIGKKKKIVLFDTLVNHYSIDEIVAVLAHEVGHYRKKHVVSGLISQEFITGLMLWLLSKWMYIAAISEALGGTGLHAGINLLAFGIAYMPLSLLISVGIKWMSRRHEFEADAFAAATSNADSLASALKKLHSDSLAHLNPHPLYVFVHYSHPPLHQRLKALPA